MIHDFVVLAVEVCLQEFVLAWWRSSLKVKRALDGASHAGDE